MLYFQHFRPVSETLTITRKFKPYFVNRFSDDDILDLTNSQQKSCLNSVSISSAKSDYKINDIRVAIMDNKPIVIPLGKTGPSYKVKFKMFYLYDFNAWYSILANDILLVLGSSLVEFEKDTYWDVDEITIDRGAGSASAISLTNEEMSELGYYTTYYNIRNSSTNDYIPYWVGEIPDGYDIVDTITRPDKGDQVIPWDVELVVYKNTTASTMDVYDV
jgi:hypothetical protein